MDAISRKYQHSFSRSFSTVVATLAALEFSARLAQQKAESGKQLHSLTKHKRQEEEKRDTDYHLRDKRGRDERARSAGTERRRLGVLLEQQQVLRLHTIYAARASNAGKGVSRGQKEQIQRLRK